MMSVGRGEFGPGRLACPRAARQRGLRPGVNSTGAFKMAEARWFVETFLRWNGKALGHGLKEMKADANAARRNGILTAKTAWITEEEL
jgi:hypothetical protein